MTFRVKVKVWFDRGGPGARTHAMIHAVATLSQPLPSAEVSANIAAMLAYMYAFECS